MRLGYSHILKNIRTFPHTTSLPNKVVFLFSQRKKPRDVAAGPMLFHSIFKECFLISFISDGDSFESDRI